MTSVGSDRILARMLALHPKIIDLTLDRCWPLLAALDNPHESLPPVIHIAGTNGKGSTQAMIRAGLEGAGNAVHAYTSPHLARFHERIRLAGTLISEDDLEAFLDETYAANGETEITYFEITTIAAMLAMSRVPADYTLLEVGLGGRLDVTNVIPTARLSIITPIDLDHQQFLGDTIAKIASEKAGILKRGVPCVVARQSEEAMDVIEAQAAKVGAPLIAYGQHWHVFEERGRLVFQDETGLLDLPMPNLPGGHQVSNAGTALAALRTLGVGDPEAAVTSAYWPARMQKLQEGPLLDLAPKAEFWLDGGHNPAAGAAIAETFGRLAPRPTHVICGMLNTKDNANFLAPLTAFSETILTVAIPGEKNAVPAPDLSAMAASVGAQSSPAENLEAAVQQIVAANPRARILICGSLYLAGHVLQTHS